MTEPTSKPTQPDKKSGYIKRNPKFFSLLLAQRLLPSPSPAPPPFSLLVSKTLHLTRTAPPSLSCGGAPLFLMWWRTAAQPPVGSGGGGAGSSSEAQGRAGSDYGGAQGGLPRQRVGLVPSSSSATADLAKVLPLPRIDGATTSGRSSSPGEEVLKSGALLDSGWACQAYPQFFIFLFDLPRRAANRLEKSHINCDL